MNNEAYDPALVAQQFLRKAPKKSPWRRARVQNLAIGSSTTHDWVEEMSFCFDFWSGYFPIMKHCDRITRFIDGVSLVAPGVDAVVIQLGINDILREGATAEATVDRLEQIRDFFAPVPTYLVPPHSVGDASPERHFWALEVRLEMEQRGIVDFAYPDDLSKESDELHLAGESCAMVGARIGAWFIGLGE